MAKQVSFEASLVKLEGIVSALEKGEMSLDESLKAFEEGVSLVRGCQSALLAAKDRMTKLTDIDDQ